jgi:hypothetical protein
MTIGNLQRAGQDHEGREGSHACRRGEAGRPGVRDGGGRRFRLFNPVNDRRISELIVDQVRLLIRQRQLNPGDRLPPERELCERFGVSRVTGREALRVLETNGLLEIRVPVAGPSSPSRRRNGWARASPTCSPCRR